MRFCGFFCWRVESLVEGVLKVFFFFEKESGGETSYLESWTFLFIFVN